MTSLSKAMEHIVLTVHGTPSDVDLARAIADVVGDRLRSKDSIDEAAVFLNETLLPLLAGLMYGGFGPQVASALIDNMRDNVRNASVMDGPAAPGVH